MTSQELPRNCFIHSIRCWHQETPPATADPIWLVHKNLLSKDKRVARVHTVDSLLMACNCPLQTTRFPGQEPHCRPSQCGAQVSAQLLLNRCFFPICSLPLATREPGFSPLAFAQDILVLIPACLFDMESTLYPGLADKYFCPPPTLAYLRLPSFPFTLT